MCAKVFIFCFVLFIFSQINIYTVPCEPLHFISCTDNITCEENNSEILTFHKILGAFLRNPELNASQVLYSSMAYFLRHSLLIFYYS